jgi:PAS domain S-box-containing protein
MIPMADAPTTGPPAARDRAFVRQLREMNEALLVSSVRLHELTEQAQKAAAALRESEVRYRTLAEATKAVTWSCPPSGLHIAPQLEWMAFTGQTADEMLGDGWTKAVHPDDFAAAGSKWRNAVASGLPFSNELRLRRHDGQWRWMRTLAVPICDAAGVVVSWFGSHVDITERKTAETALRQSHDTYLSLIESNPFGVYLVDADFRMAQVSAGVQKVFGAIGPVIGRDFAEIVRILWQEPIAGEVIARFRHTLETGEPYHSKDTTGKRANRDADESFEWQIERVTLPGGRFGVVCYFYDLTERKRMEEHNRLLMSEVNHRAKNLLAVVKAVARQTAKHSSPAIFMETLSKRIDGLAASQDLLVKNQWRGIELAHLVEAQLAHFKDLIGTRVLLDGPPVRLTPAAAEGIGMALHELATNAGKYGALSNSEGRLRISWQVTAADKPTFSMSWSEDGGPSVTSPTRKGFGQTVIGRIVEAAVHGTAEIDYRENGVFWKLSALVANTLKRDQ